MKLDFQTYSVFITNSGAYISNFSCFSDAICTFVEI